MPIVVKNHGLTIIMFAIFALSAIGLSFTGWNNYNNDQQEHGEQPVGYVEYLASPDFGEALTENWESEFLQMGMYVLLTAFLFQRGSAESKDPDKKEEVDDDGEDKKNDRDAPWPVRQGGIVLALYRHSLSISLLLLFALSFALHAITGAAEYSQSELAHGGQPVTAIGYLFTSRFWFESLQNWQSEFLAVGMLVVLSIVLRQQGSPESKPVGAPDHQTGE